MKVAFRSVMLAAAASLLTLAGCADVGDAGRLVGPGAAPVAARAPSGGLTERPTLQPLARFRTKPQVTIAWAKKWIGPAGGRLDFQGFAIDVPAGAVGKVTQFSIRLPVDPQGSEHVVAEFGPHGSSFAVPVNIEFPLRGTTLEGVGSATVLWWDGGHNSWVNMGAEPTADGLRLRSTTTHFSTFGTGETEFRGGTVIVSGG